MWSFETDPEYQKELDWIDEFVKRRIEPLDFVVRAPYDTKDSARNKIIRPLQKEVQERGLWACHHVVIQLASKGAKGHDPQSLGIHIKKGPGRVIQEHPISLPLSHAVV